MAVEGKVVCWFNESNDLAYSDREIGWFPDSLREKCIPLVDQSLLAQANLRIAQLEKLLSATGYKECGCNDCSHPQTCLVKKPE